MVYVKNTMPNRLADMVIPHYCCTCGEIGGVLCESCRNNIVSEPFTHCLVCLQPIMNNRGLCTHHAKFAIGVSAVGWRRDGLEKLVDISKFESVRSGCVVQAELLASKLPVFNGSVAIIPIPTIAKHIRWRGYGHAELIARKIAQIRDYNYCPLLLRRTDFVQHGASKIERERQARSAFAITKNIDNETTYVLVDDVYTTGATMRAALRLLKSAGACEIWIAVTSRQPLE